MNPVILFTVFYNTRAVAQNPQSPEIEAGESRKGVNAAVPLKLVSLKINLTVDPSRNPCSSARLNRMSLEPLGLKLLAIWGENETCRRSVM